MSAMAILLLILLTSPAFSQRIYQWEEEGVDNYSNNPAEVPFDIFFEGGTNQTKTTDDEEQALVKLSETLNPQAQEKLKLIVEAESKLEQIIIDKRAELRLLRSIKDTPTDKIVDLENYIFKAEHNLKLIKTEKATFIKQNQNS